MNCQLVRNRILAVEEPTRLPHDLAAHLDGCAACRSWHRTALFVDKVLTSLPVPESDGFTLTAVLERIRSGPSRKKAPAPAKPAPSQPAPPKAAPTLPATVYVEPPAPKLELIEPAPSNHKLPPSNHKPAPLRLEDDLPSRKRRTIGEMAAKLWPAGVVAATLLIGAVAWVSLREGNTPVVSQAPPDQMLEALVKLNVELAKTIKPKERVPILANIADEVNREMVDIARADATGENMQALEEMYRKVLNGLLEQAKAIDKNDKSQLALLNRVADGLSQAGQKAEQRATESPPQSAEPLRGAALVARQGASQLRVIVKEART